MLGLGGRNTVRQFFTRPFPFRRSASGFQHSEQMSYSRPSISLSRHSFVSPQRSQTVIGSPEGTAVVDSSALNREGELPQNPKNSHSRPVLRKPALARGFPLTRAACDDWSWRVPRFDPMFYSTRADHISGPSAVATRIEPMALCYLQASIGAGTGAGQRIATVGTSEQEHVRELLNRFHVVPLTLDGARRRRSV